MTTKLLILLAGLLLLSCGAEKEKTQAASASDPATLPLVGTWKLLRGTLIEKGQLWTQIVSIVATAVFTAGGGSYSLSDSSYTEKLEYCTARDWEGHDFTFTVSINNDTLVQRGQEKVESAGIDRINIEKYVRVKE